MTASSTRVLGTRPGVTFFFWVPWSKLGPYIQIGRYRLSSAFRIGRGRFFTSKMSALGSNPIQFRGIFEPIWTHLATIFRYIRPDVPMLPHPRTYPLTAPTACNLQTPLFIHLSNFLQISQQNNTPTPILSTSAQHIISQIFKNMKPESDDKWLGRNTEFWEHQRRTWLMRCWCRGRNYGEVGAMENPRMTLSCIIYRQGVQENLRSTCDHLRVRLASDLWVFKSVCVPFVMQLRCVWASASNFGKPVRVVAHWYKMFLAQVSISRYERTTGREAL